MSTTPATAATGNVAATGTNASTSIDFTSATVDNLKGSGIVIDGKKIDFYDSADGKYTGNADFAIDLNGARNGQQIVAKIVDAMSGTYGDSIVESQAATKATYNASNSALDNVFLTQDGSKLVITAQTAGVDGNNISTGNNTDVTVKQTYGNNRLTGEAVISAKGLTDGEHKVTIEYVAASATVGGKLVGDASLVDDDPDTANVNEGTVQSITLTADSKLTSGNYRLYATALDTVKMQYQAADGNWQDMVGDYAGTKTVADNGSVTFNDVTFKFSGSAAGEFSAAADTVNFSIDAAHYEATLTEAGSDTAGTAVRVGNGENSVTLTAADGVGEAVVDIGSFDAASFEVGDKISWSFETAAAQSSETVTGGTFTAKLQIGANQGQSFQMDIKDMRSQALQVAGTSAGAKAGGVDGAFYTAVKNVTAGTDDVAVEFALDVSTHDKATAAIKVINNAIEQVSAQRSQLGAYQNRLEHTINNLGTSSENLTAAESRIRDVDMAKEMMEFTKNNILSQAAQAMLAQANQQPQGVLQLLR
jgi:flagellin